MKPRRACQHASERLDPTVSGPQVSHLVLLQRKDYPAHNSRTEPLGTTFHPFNLVTLLNTTRLKPSDSITVDLMSALLSAKCIFNGILSIPIPVFILHALHPSRLPSHSGDQNVGADAAAPASTSSLCKWVDRRVGELLSTAKCALETDPLGGYTDPPFR
ncbi:unnamed protein product [Pleuronectes platessa]|uniref:Uncharacterized protein n=1 Tax=Pleuronectes platessa TaxID=8262 RepID=A0A9N7V0R2_PLEPL|nr:unnamed protein product [Pleuronectes platessa]